MKKKKEAARGKGAAAKCKFCGARAKFVAAQSINLGASIEYVLICDSHRDGWNEGGDWTAPIYLLGERVE